MPPPAPTHPPDGDTVRILLSTDNHLGYLEADGVRSEDSFAAMEEVLYLARKFSCDMVLLAGDLFHDHKPSRRTLHRTLQLFRHYCLGENPVLLHTLHHRPLQAGRANYHDPHVSVERPVFAIHGNHDDPSRDAGGGPLLAALDLLSVTSLVNYMGRHGDQLECVEIAPVLLQKGATHIALYGLGALRDERLHRLWKSGQVKFVKPTQNDNEHWFHIFALHQNRDVGRGAKNCVQDTMIPDWMDLVVWGHEHECRIDLEESLVGTFRITQPGSSVATSLVAGEAVRKHVGVLDVKGSQFRLFKVPLTQVRSLAHGEVVLQGQAALDPHDLRLDEKLSAFLEERVAFLCLDAKEQRQLLLQAAVEAGNDYDPQKLPHPDQVLVRLRVNHTGFGTTLRNQPFGAKFVGKVANLSDILLFHRQKDNTSSGKSSTLRSMDRPLAPAELERTNVEDLVHEFLAADQQKTQVLEERALSLALEDFVDKDLTSSIEDSTVKHLSKKQKKLCNEKDAFLAVGTKDSRTVIQEELRSQSSSAKAPSAGTVSREDNDEEENQSPPAINSSRAKGRSSTNKGTSRKRPAVDEDFDDDDEEDAPPPPPRRKAAPTSKAPPSRSRRRATKKPVTYDLHSDDQADDLSEEVRSAEESDEEMVIVDEPMVVQRKPRKRAVSRAPKRTFDSDDDDRFDPNNDLDLDDDWGTAATRTQR